jgi:hypothetical protein
VLAGLACLSFLHHLVPALLQQLFTVSVVLVKSDLDHAPAQPSSATQ